MSDYYCAEYDADGHIRMDCGRGVLVANAVHTRADVQEWLDRSESDRFREQYRAALALLDGRRCPDLTAAPISPHWTARRRADATVEMLDGHGCERGGDGRLIENLATATPSD